MRIPRALLWSLAVVAVVAGGALWWAYASRDALIKQAIERYGPQLTGVNVKVASVAFQPFDGSGEIRGLEIGNPPGYKSPRALSLSQIRLAVDPASLTDDVVHVKELSLEAPSITYEKGPGGDNLTTIEKHIESALPRISTPNSAPAKGERKAEKRAKERRFIVDRVQVRKARVSYGGMVDVDMPDLVLRDLGRKSGGATAAQITQEVWTALTRQAIASAPAALRGLEERAKGAVDRLKGLFK